MSTLASRVRGLPRAVIGTTLQTARLPLDTLARVAGQQGNDGWPPATAFETAEATVETVLGGLLRDGELVRRGRLRHARLAKLRQAGELEAAARQQRAHADDEFRARREEVAQRRGSVGRTAQTRGRQVEKRAAERKRQARGRTEARQRAAREQAAATRQAVDRDERASRLTATEATAKTVGRERAALIAEDQALAAERALERTREARGR